MQRIAVFGGVYANPFALRAVLDDALAQGAAELFCLGDLGGFGADCDAVWPVLTDAGVQCIAGNYDVAIGRGDTDCGCGYASARDNEFAQLMYDHTLASTSADFAAWMTTLPPELRLTRDGADLHLVHGSPIAINDFVWESLDDDELRLRLDHGGGPRPDVLLCTHTGLPWQRVVDDTLVVNVGAIGRPANDGTQDVWYALVDLDDGDASAELRAVDYDWRAQAASMRAAGLPEPFVETIETGWWTTCLEVMPPPERSRGRFHVYRESMPTGFDQVAGADFGGPSAAVFDERPVTALFGTPLFPPRLWIYTNFHCNLACDYCVVASSPTARRRSLSLARIAELADEALAEGFTELYLTGGEPFVHADAVAIVEAACDRLPTIVLTNAMLFTGRRRAELGRLAGRENLVLQSSLDGSTPELHDPFRGPGSWRRALDGISYARGLGLPVRVAMTQTIHNRDDVPRLRRLLDELGVTGDDFAVRPLVARGLAADGDGVAVSPATMVPELTVTADGVHWHPVGADLASSPDFLIARGRLPLAEAKRLVVERFLTLRHLDGTLPAAFACAV
ncbi:MAG TPA: radical SAM protein [Solirubrobacteraceae bacterium]|jgi:pyruvate-formate lyase-activating enzyme/diadenosine tetraphosphatase ApaH/serine/threonine PP2A family protein phosphatase|nr:radical SAM protein [Solirubrobacteraceae bacterium]